MEELNYNKVKEEFIKYYNEVSENTKKDILKYNHSFEVAELMVDLAEKMNLKEEQVILARIIGLLHDIGRFEQIKKYDTLKDHESFDHADYGVNYLFKENNIRKYIESDKYDLLIATSILYHNKKTLPDYLSEDEEIYAKMIRDCDKIDIFKQVALLEQDEFNKDELTDKVLKDFKKGKLVNNTDIKTKTDYTVSLFSFIYDFNYNESLDLLVYKDNFEFYLSVIEVDDKSEELFNELKKICFNKIEEGV